MKRIIFLFLILMLGCAQMETGIKSVESGLLEVKTLGKKNVLHSTKMECGQVSEEQQLIPYLHGANKYVSMLGVKPIKPGYKNSEICRFYEKYSDTEIKLIDVKDVNSYTASGWLYSGDTLVNAEIIRAGWAIVDEATAGENLDLLKQALTQAKEAPKGYWHDLKLAEEKERQKRILAEKAAASERSRMREIYTCATCTRSDCAAKIKGKWQSDLATMTYDFERGYIARQVAILNPEVYRGKIIKCEKDYMVYKNPHGETMVRFLSINKIKLSGEGKLTFEFRRISGDLSVIENHIK